MFGKLTSAFTPSRPAITIAQPTQSSSRWGKSTGIPRHRVGVVGIERETPDAITLLLEPVGGKPISFRAGQYLTHCLDIDGATVKRAYSISAAEGDRLACTIKTVANGVASQFIADDVSVGYEYTVIGPTGDFLLPAKASAPLAFLAAGSGITPVMALIATALRDDPDRVIDLVYAARRQSEVIFAERLAKLEGDHPGLTITRVFSRPDEDWTGPRGRLEPEQAAQLLTAHADAEIYLCGPEDLMATTTAALLADGVGAGRIHTERFFAAAQHTTPLPTIPQPIEFRRSNLTIVAQPGETILEAGLRHGVKLDYSCTVGGCGACKVRMVSGAVSIDEPNCLTDAEKANGETLACSAYALEPAVVDA
ncbi:ferredoxin--NADP reductase [Mycobacterium sp. M1]|uniref:Ferredoxin--NADP reductase n=1 Tax=Mycolicibacter acidiphilus TaxID=2835306 RepID=A0ABS5RM78_9MYCO|nr:ferredoxin--NADP reductase [Mycolicibacter acidiphilus]MBS9534669.1 ferredoxin--NADP reductase [Mycolicibacter acidiphilus]